MWVHHGSGVEIGGRQQILVLPDHQGRLPPQQQRDVTVAFKPGRNAGQRTQRFERVVQVRVQSCVGGSLALAQVVIHHLGRKRVDLVHRRMDFAVDAVGDAGEHRHGLLEARA
jgi:hypothetical protein